MTGTDNFSHNSKLRTTKKYNYKTIMTKKLTTLRKSDIECGGCGVSRNALFHDMSRYSATTSSLTPPPLFKPKGLGN